MSVLATVGLAALAALGATGNIGLATEAPLCSVPAGAAELSAPLEIVPLAAASDRPDWCTEKDALADPRCGAEGSGDRPPGSTTAPVQLRVHALGGEIEPLPRVMTGAAPPWAHDSTGAALDPDGPFRPPRS